MFVEFYSMFMTDPFMNTLFDMSSIDTNHDQRTHGKRLGLYFLNFFGNDKEYNDVRPGHPVPVETSHIRAKGCPTRGKYSGQGFTYNQVYTWFGYMATAAKAKGFPDE